MKRRIAIVSYMFALLIPLAAFALVGQVSGSLLDAQEVAASVSATASSSTAYDIIVVIGQSNAVGYGLGTAADNPYYDAQASNVFELGRIGADNMEIIPAAEPLQNWDLALGGDPQKGWAYPLALRYSTLTSDGRKVLIIPAARGATSILQWDRTVQNFSVGGVPDSTQLYADMRNRVNYALSLNPQNRVVAVVWDQGEADVAALGNPNNPLHAFMSTSTLYQSKLKWLRSQMRSDFSSQGCFPLLVVGLSHLWKPVNGKASGAQAYADITSAQKAATASDSCGKSAYVDTNGLTKADFNSDLEHFSAEGARIMSSRIFLALKPFIPPVQDPAVSIVATNPVASETGPVDGIYMVTRTSSSTASALSIPFTMSGTAVNGTDYTLSGVSDDGMVTIPSGASGVAVTLTPLANAPLQSAKTAVMTLDSGSGYELAASSSAISITDTVSPSAAYDIIIVVGQSNAVGRGLGLEPANSIYLAQAQNVFELGRYGSANMQIMPAVEPLQNWGQDPSNPYFNINHKGWAYPLALRYATLLASSSRKVLIIPAAEGSTGILQWDLSISTFKGGRADSTLLYNDMRNRVNYALSLNPQNRVVAVVWDQGETDVLGIGNPKSDFFGLMSSGTYQSKLEWLRSQMHSDFSTQGCFPFVVVGMSKLWQPVNGRQSGIQARTDIINAQKAAAASDSCGKSAYVDTNAFTKADFNSDLLHFSAEGAYLMSSRIFLALKPLLQ